MAFERQPVESLVAGGMNIRIDTTKDLDSKINS